jgi:hypothetical protein
VSVGVNVSVESGWLPPESGDCWTKLRPTDRGSEKHELKARA